MINYFAHNSLLRLQFLLYTVQIPTEQKFGYFLFIKKKYGLCQSHVGMNYLNENFFDVYICVLAHTCCSTIV